MKFIYQAVIFLLIASLSGCVSTPSTMSATNDEDQDIGLGGTGLLAGSSNTGGSGLGGTGIIGEITGFGSIFVNGIEVEYDIKTPFTINGKKSSHQQLAIGDMVEILTTNTNAYTHAQSINLRHEVIGKVEAVNKETNSFNVLGQTILQANNKPLPEPGHSVAVAGLRVNKQTIQATRVSAANGLPTLLRTHKALPFSTQTTRWLIQTHVQNNKVALNINGVPHSISLNDKQRAPLSGLSNIKVLELQTSSKGNIKFVREIDSMRMLRGSRTPTPTRQPGGQRLQRISPSPMKMKSQPKMPRMGR